MAATFFNWLIGRGGEKVISTISDVVDGFHHSGEEKSAENVGNLTNHGQSHH
jgi:hypothetical protein